MSKLRLYQNCMRREMFVSGTSYFSYVDQRMKDNNGTFHLLSSFKFMTSLTWVSIQINTLMQSVLEISQAPWRSQVCIAVKYFLLKTFFLLTVLNYEHLYNQIFIYNPSLFTQPHMFTYLNVCDYGVQNQMVDFVLSTLK